MAYHNRYRRGRRVKRDQNVSGDYRVLIVHHTGGEAKDDIGYNEILVVSNSGRFVKHWQYINVHHKGRDIDEARKIMKRLSGEWT